MRSVLLTILLSLTTLVWGVEWDAMIGEISYRSYIRLPRVQTQVQAILYTHQNMTEEVLFRSDYFCRQMDSLGVAMVYVQQGSQNWDLSEKDAHNRTCQERFEWIIQSLADLTHHPELTRAWIIPFGHSAQATFPWNFAAWNPQRTLCILSYHGDAPRTNLCGYGRENVEWGRTRNIDSIPALMIEGEYEWWEDRVNPALAFRIMYPQSRISFLCDAERGHFDLCPATQYYMVRFIAKALHNPRPKDGVYLSRWYADGKQSRHPQDQFWYFDKEMRDLTLARYRQSWGKKTRSVTPVLNGVALSIDSTQHIKVKATIDTDTFIVEPNATLISGAAHQIGPNTFVAEKEYWGSDPKRLWDGITLCVEIPGDKHYKDAVRELCLYVKKPKPAPIELGIVYAKSGDTIRLEAGKQYEGQIIIQDCHHVVVEGNGATLLPKGGRGYGVEIANSQHVIVRGLTTTQVPTGGSEHVLIEDVKCYTSYSWGDGLNIFSSSYVTIRRCYAETNDDCLTVYASRKGFHGHSRHILVEDCVFAPKIAHPIFIGLHGAASDPTHPNDIDTIEDLTFRRIRVIDQKECQLDYQGCMAIVAGDNNVVRNVLFEDIMVDRISNGSLLTLRIFKNEKYCQAPGMCIDGVTFRRITAPEGGNPSLIHGYSPDRQVRNILFEDLRIGGEHISDDMPSKPKWYKTADMARFVIGNYVTNIQFK